MRSRVFVVWAVVMLVVLNGLIVQKERVLKTGSTLLLPLGPRDPRSLMQGDYMVLRYVQPTGLSGDLPRRGLAVFAIDDKRVGTFSRVLQSGEVPAPNELQVQYRKVGGDFLFAADSYLFQEGKSRKLSAARFGELKVAPGGECLLVGLRDANLVPLDERPSP